MLSKKKTLVIGGVGLWQEVGVQKWCEAFGEVSGMRRMSNGDIHVTFKKAKVADTVCRVQARVFIEDIGSVQLSWFEGK